MLALHGSLPADVLWGSFVTHSNECVTNEPQRTSAGRLLAWEMEPTTRWSPGFSYWFSIVSLGLVTPLQSFHITGRPRKQFKLPFQQRIESCLLKRSVKKILYGFICYIYRIKIYILKRYDVLDLLSKKTPWHPWNVKAFFKQSICRKRHEQSLLRFDRNGPIRTITNIKNLTREIIVSETSQILQIFAAQEQKCREKAPCFRSYWGKLKEDENNW